MFSQGQTYSQNTLNTRYSIQKPNNYVFLADIKSHYIIYDYSKDYNDHYYVIPHMYTNTFYWHVATGGGVGAAPSTFIKNIFLQYFSLGNRTHELYDPSSFVVIPFLSLYIGGGLIHFYLDLFLIFI